MQERAHRRVDREGAHHLVQLPILSGLQPVVTIDAAALSGHRWIYRPEDRLAADGHELRYRRGVGPVDKGLDRGGHCRIGGRRRDGAPRPADPAQLQCIGRAARLIEQLDRVSPEGRWDGRAVAPELHAQIGVVADERIDQLECGPFFVGLVCDVGVETDLVETIARDAGQHGGEGQDRDPAEALSRFQESDCGGTPAHQQLSFGPASG